MSESVTPGAPADSGAPTPAANTQPAISISDAARLLSRQRRAAPAAVGETAGAGGDAAGAVVDAGRKPSPNEVAAAALAPDSKPTAAASPPQPGPLSAMEQALGVPPTDGAPPAPAVDPSTPLPSPITIEGRQLRTIADLQKFASDKSADYTTKSQELAEGRKHLENQMSALSTVLPLIQPELQRLAQIVQDAPPDPDPALLDSDPNQYHRQRAAWEAHQREMQRLGALTQVQTQAQARAMEQAVASANETLAKEFPFWADPKQRLEAQQQIVTWALDKGGFNRDELRNLSSPHHLKTMMKAAMWDRWMDGARTTAPVAPGAPVRGAAPPPATSERVTQAAESFQRKADFKSGAALLAARRAANS